MNRVSKFSVCFSLFLLSFLGTSNVFADSGTGVVKADVLNVRQAPDTGAAVLAKLYNKEEVPVLEVGSGWYKIKVEGSEGWVCGEYLEVNSPSAQTTGTVQGYSVNIRSDAGTWASKVATVNDGDNLTILGRSDNWINVQLSDGTTGWIREDFVSVGTSRGTDIRSQIVKSAKKYIGVRYSYGGMSPKGFDCSGFVKYVMDNCGFQMTRVAAEQAGQGTWIGKENLRPGDLVFFDTNGGKNYINHSGIYIGDGLFIHASSGSAHSVTTSSLYDDFYANAYMTARRVVR